MENMSYFGITSYFALFILHITLFYFEQGTDENYYDFFCITSYFYSVWNVGFLTSGPGDGRLGRLRGGERGAEREPRAPHRRRRRGRLLRRLQRAVGQQS